MIDNFLQFLLVDKTTGRNIIWAKDGNIKEITKDDLSNIIPRYTKSLQYRMDRTNNYGEIFTPVEVVEIQNQNAFSSTDWQEKIQENQLEVSCGEAPYLVNVYDVSNGTRIDLEARKGLLDTKLKLVKENALESNWWQYMLMSYKSTYAFDYQGDNVFLARKNLVQTFIDYYQDFFSKPPTDKEIMEIIDIVCWNVWQMDFLTLSIPMIQVDILNGIYSTKCKIKDWETNNVILFEDLIQEKEDLVDFSNDEGLIDEFF